MYRSAHVYILVADGMAPNRHQSISIHHVNPTEYSVIWIILPDMHIALWPLNLRKVKNRQPVWYFCYWRDRLLTALTLWSEKSYTTKIPDYYSGAVTLRLKSPATRLLVNSYSGPTAKETKIHTLSLYKGNPPVIGGFPSQRASNAKNVSTWWRHHGLHTKD